MFAGGQAPYVHFMPPDAEAVARERYDAGFAPLRRFLPYLWPAHAPELKTRVVISLVLVLVAKGVQIGTTYLLSGAVDRMAAGLTQAVALAAGLVIAYAAARFLGVLFDNARNAIFERVGLDAARRLSEQVFRHIHRLSLRFHLERRTGALTKIVERGTKSIDTMLYFLLFNIAPTAIELVIVSAIFWIEFGPGLVVATVVMVAAYVTFTRVVTDWRNRLRREMNDLDNRMIARAVDSMLNYETVKYFNAEAHEADRYGGALRKLNAAGIRNETSLAWLNVGQSLITNLMMGGALAYTVYGWSTGRFSTGDVVLVNGLLLQLFRPLDALGWVYRNIRQGLIDMEQMFSTLDTNEEIQDTPGAPDLAVARGHVRFEGLRFSYEPEREILHGLDLDVPSGTSLAVVGPSGAGKSTLARLLFRFYDPQGGRITVDGQDIRAVTQDSLRRAIGIVPQDTVLFNETIGYNIAYGRSGATREQIEAAARGAALHDFIAALPEGYDTPVGERGLKLSGGEKQRVAIARTLLKDPPILILDEATSALDSRTEAAIQDTLRGATARRTAIIVAHRLSTIVDADQIAVLDGGRVVERGTHDQLLRRGGLYAEMWTRQQAEVEPERQAAE